MASTAGAGFRIGVDAPEGLRAYLVSHGWLPPREPLISVAPAGDGNMNCTLRVVTPRRRLIVKQARPWVERYPDVPAPIDRTLVEARFYAHVARVTGVGDRMPACLGVDAESRILVLCDCVGFADLTAVYGGTRIGPAVVSELLEYLAALHRLPVGPGLATAFGNTAMRRLNHEHLFCRPLAGDAGLHARLDAITPGLAALARGYAADARVRDRVGALGELYMDAGPEALVHGDFFPGSWLSDGSHVRIIDPEFCFAGSPAFDYGTMAAHLMLAAQDEWLVGRVARAARAAGCDETLVAGFAGVEIVRRILGVAQLPGLRRSLAEKAALLVRSRRLLLRIEVLGSSANGGVSRGARR
ncbi:MAG: phosphotransferase [Acidobacteriota bacterium]